MNVATRQVPASVGAPIPALDAVLARVRALCRRRMLWLEHLARAVTDAPGDASSRALLDLDAPEAEARFLDDSAEARRLSQEADAYERQVLEDEDSRLRRLVEALELTLEERDLVQLCLALAVEPALGHVYGRLSGADGPAAVSEAMAARICGHGREAMWGPASALGRWQVLAVSARDGTLQLDPFVLGFLRGLSEIDPELLACCRVSGDAPAPLDAWPVGDVVARITDALNRGRPVRMRISGPPLCGRKSFAGNVADALGRPLVVIDTERIENTRWSDVRRRVQRQALLHHCAVAWTGEGARRGLEREPGAMDLEILIGETDDDAAIAAGWHEERVAIPALSSAERRALWLRRLPAVGAWPTRDLDHLAERFHVTVGEIAHVAVQGEDTVAGVQRLTRALSRDKLGDLAQLTDCPFERDDLFLPAPAAVLLDEFLFEARARTAFWERAEARRLFPRGVGLIGLLSGPPGTGKTMAAQVIAAELGLDLFRVDLATTVDKYIGETAKHLRRLFARAREMNAVLLFDEADALFSRRTDTRDSHDRYANADTSYLLQLVEDYPGVALLATNKRQQIDDAFVRRIRYVFYLPRPECAERLAIWRQVIAALASADCATRLDEELQRLAADAPMTGAQIKNAVLAAAFLSRREEIPLAPIHLARAIERLLINQGGSLAAEPGRARR